MSLPEAYGATSVPCFYYSMAICLVLQCATFSHIGCSKPYMVEQAKMVVLVKICGHVLVSFELAQSPGGYLTE